MRILINCSTLVVGGGVQVAVSIITELKKNKDHIFTVVLSREVFYQLNLDDFPANFEFHLFDKSPARLRSRNKLRKKLDKIEECNHIDFVVTVFGPSYWKPQKAKHLCGFALPWMIYPNSEAFNKLNLKEKIRVKLLNFYKFFYFKNDCDLYWCETDIVKDRMVKYLDFDKKNIYVIGNTFSHFFADYKSESDVDCRQNEYFELLTVSAYYPHKNLDLIKKIIPLISLNKKKIKFYLTLPQVVFDGLFNTSEELQYVVNLGVIDNKDCPKYYNKADAVFLPSLLECFSANYPEAMYMKRPIITSNLDFAQSICKDTALYFDPLDPKDAYEKILELMKNAELRRKLIERTGMILEQFPTPMERANKLIGICEENIVNSTPYKYI